jgi:hypothetical protein
MKNRITGVISIIIISITMAFGQEATQTVRGKLVDADSKTPLIGVTVVVLGSEPLIGTATDANGTFKLPKVPLGRVTLKLSYLGYEERTLPNVVVDAGSEVVLDLSMQESVSQLNEIVIKAPTIKGKAQNDMALLSGRSVSLEETKRYAGGFNDPAMILSNFAGVTTGGTGSNEVIVRGNSSKYVQWRLEGVEITNPNHFADQNAVSGGVSALNNNLLATSDFYTGAFSAEYGDVLSGIYDVKLRNGNNEKTEAIVGLGVAGTELTAEGPFKKGYEGSYLANYRYSTFGLLNDLGVVNIEGAAPTFQDGAFKMFLPTKKMGTFALFGLGGLSKIRLDNINPSTWTLPDNQAGITNLRKDYTKASYLLNIGLNHSLPISEKSYLNTTLSFSGNGVEDEMFRTDVKKLYDNKGVFLRDSLYNKRKSYNNQIDNEAYRMAVTYHTKINARNKIQVGTKYTNFHYTYQQTLLENTTGNSLLLSDFDENIGTVRNFVNWKHRFNEDVTMVAGIHNMNVLYNKKSTIEPRLAFNWHANERGTWSAGYGLHSTMENVHNYFAKVKQPNGTYIEPNKNLDLLKAHHLVVGYEYLLTQNLRVKAEAYYQHLYDLPVENVDTSYYATINEGLNFSYLPLVNKGKGKNYGVELTIERFFHKNYYFLINGSVFQSKYQSLEGKERNTAFADNYLVNVLFGKEFVHLGKKKNQTLALNGKVFFGGGKKHIPLLRNPNGTLAVSPSTGQFWDYDKAYNNNIDDIYQISVSASYKWNKTKTTHELYLVLDNLTNNLSRISEHFDDSKPNSIGYVKQMSFLPNLMYRIYL